MTNLASGALPLLHLAEENIDAIAKEVSYAEEHWTRQGFHRQHAEMLIARTRLDLYRGRPSTAWERIDKVWPKAVGSGAFDDPVIYAECWMARARAAISEAAHTGERSAIKQAVAAIKGIRKSSWAWTDPWADLLEAGLKRLRNGDPIKLLERAQEGFEEHDMGLGAHLARRAIGRVTGSRGASDADRWMAGQGIRDPERFAAVLSPGLQ